MVKNREIYIPNLLGGPHRNFTKMFSIGKTRMMGLPYAEEGYDMLSRSDTILEHDRWTDSNSSISIVRQHRGADVR